MMADRSARGRLPLRGADLVLMAMHDRWKRAGISSNAMLVVDSDGPVEPDRVRGALLRFIERCPWPAARLARPFPWGTLRWVAGAPASRAAPSVRYSRVGSRAEIERALETELNSDIDPRREPPLRALVLDQRPKGGGAARGTLVLTWFHPLMDPRGAQNLLGHLVALDRADGAPPRRATEHTRAPDPRPLRERGVIARRSLAYLQTLAPVPPISPGAGRVPSGRIRVRRATFTDHARDERRPPREISWRLAVVGRAMAGLWERRGLPDAPFLVPIAVDLRPKGAPGPTFGNCLAFHFARFAPSETADTALLASALRGQMADAVRDGQIEANAVAMDFLQYRPLSMMLRALPWAAGGDAFSFNCADVTEFPRSLDRVFGRRVVNAYHLPAVVPRPGIGVFFNRCGRRDNVVVSWAEGAVEDAEASRVLQDVSVGMGFRGAVVAGGERALLG